MTGQINDSIIAGALFDFAGFLTTRDTVTPFGASADAAPMVSLLKEWAGLRGLSLDDANVEGWEHLTPPTPASAPVVVLDEWRVVDKDGGCTGAHPSLPIITAQKLVAELDLYRPYQAPHRVMRVCLQEVPNAEP